MKFPRLFLPFALCLLPWMNGCAKSPSGGPVNTAPNRLQVTLNLKGTISRNAYYAVAFDDDVSRAGPRAIITGSASDADVLPQNGIVGGTYRFAVIYGPDGFRAFLRPNPSDQTRETVDLSSQFFVGGGAPRATTNAINFTLNLDARASDGSYYFAHDSSGQLVPTELQINAIGTNAPLRRGDNRIKPVDALGAGETSSPVRFQIGGTRRASINDDFGSSDRNFYDSSFNSTVDPDYVNFNQLDLKSLDLSVTRG